MNVEAGSLHLLVLNHKVFGGKKFSKLGLDFVADGHWFVSDEPSIRKRPPFTGGLMTLLEVGQSSLGLS
jgi:hypothetical protein